MQHLKAKHSSWKTTENSKKQANYHPAITTKCSACNSTSSTEQSVCGKTDINSAGQSFFFALMEFICSLQCSQELVVSSCPERVEYSSLSTSYYFLKHHIKIIFPAITQSKWSVSSLSFLALKNLLAYHFRYVWTISLCYI